MPSILSVAEKPSVAKSLAEIIAGCSPDSIRRNGFSIYNKIYDIPNCSFRGQPCKMSMTSVSGHLLELDFDIKFKSWANCSPIDLFNAPIIKSVKDENVDIQRTLEAEAKKNQILLLWLDCDLEGENIAFEVERVCKAANPRLDVWRARFSAVSAADVLRNMTNPDRLNVHMNDAVEARQEIDLRIGAAFTRLQTTRLQKRFDAFTKVISYGPCQFPTLGFVVQRHLDIEQFISAQFWYITCEADFPHPDQNPEEKKMLTMSFNWDRHRLYDRLAVLILYAKCVQEGENLATVIQCDSRPTKHFRPIPLNTIDFQVLASRKLHISSDKAMQIAEALYQRGILSYPRTETNFFTQEFDLLKYISDQRIHPDWGTYASNLLDIPMGQPNSFEFPRNGGKNDEAHPPIHPLRMMRPDELGDDFERKIYELVTRHFLACCSRDAIGSETNIIISIPDQHKNIGETFSAKGLMILERNFLDVYSKYDSWKSKKVPLLHVGDTFPLKKLFMSEGNTSPPEYLSESELIMLMDKNGIGTDATIAQHIATILSREYAIKSPTNHFQPTKLGLALVEGYNNMGYQLNKPQLRAAIESDVQKVARGEMSRQEAVSRCISTMKACFVAVCKEVIKLDQAVEKHFTRTTGVGQGNMDLYSILDNSFTKCGQCQSNMDLRADATDHDKNRLLFCQRCSKGYSLPAKCDFSRHEATCPICHFQVVTVETTYGMGKKSTHTICPYCYNNPPDVADGGMEGMQDNFRCLSCAKENCVLALRTSNVDIAPCHVAICDGYYRVKRHANGSLCFSCTNKDCKTVWWLPKYIKQAEPVAERFCSRCERDKQGVKVTLVEFKFDLVKAPRGVDPTMMLCPACDRFWEEKCDVAPMIVRRGNTVANSATAFVDMVGSGSRGVQQHQQQAMQQQQQVHRPPASVIDLSSSSSRTTTFAQDNNAYDAALKGLSVNKRQPPQLANTFSRSSFAPAFPVAPPSSSNPYDADSNPGDGIACKCGMPVVMRTVIKEGANKGRTFFSCPKPQAESCGYFQWTDEPPRATTSSLPTTPGFTRAVPAPAVAEGPLCQCGIPAVQRTTNKAGANQGKQFYCCSKRQ